ncbi:MAG TPA: rhodanese-like domain-containing protein [Vicinamibacterales bacterium]|jgi:predicted sulfurtransferase|nr:rhodanese-like domain-containing protein [Vicinamibacterales bacterium]
MAGCIRSLVLAAAVVVLAAPAVRAQEQDEAPRITQQAFKRLLARKNVIVVDTRNPEAYPLGHIRGALLLPLEGQLTWSDEYQKTVVEVLKRTKKPVVTYCA